MSVWFFNLLVGDVLLVVMVSIKNIDLLRVVDILCLFRLYLFYYLRLC